MAQKRKLFGLLVGIDAYPGAIPDLRGCVNDVEAFGAYLRETASEDFEQPRLRLLKNEEATRESLIRGFREHLSQAGPDDVALFYYAGHGAQEHAPEEFWPLEPDRLDETLVCFDSRTEGGWDLADKELATLIAEVAAKNPHVVIILDCCHSGSGTRDPELAGTAVRKIETDRRARPLETFLSSGEELEALGNTRAPGGTGSSGWSLPPEGRHVLIAACQDGELAKEYNAEGKTWGTLSYFLRQTLASTTRPLSYHELLTRVRARVEGSVAEQRPQLEATRTEDVHQPFLGGVVRERAAYLVYFDKDAGWSLDAGAVHGVPQPAGAETARLALFPVEADADTLRDPEKALAEAEVREVLPQRSRLESGGNLDTAAQYAAVVTSLPLPPLPVSLKGDPLGSELAREALAKSGPGENPSLYVREAEHPEYRLLAKEGAYLITRAADDRPLVKQVAGGYTPENARRAAERLEHIARWAKVRDLENPTSRLDPNAVKMILHYDGTEYTSTAPTFEYRLTDGAWRHPEFRLELRNEGDRTLYCAVLALSESYSVDPGLFPAGQTRLEPGEEAWAYGGRPIPAVVPDEFWRAGVTERQDILKLVVSTGPFDATLLQQGGLEAPDLRSDTRAAHGPTGALNRLMARVQTRELGGPGPTGFDDWTTGLVPTLTVRPHGAAVVPTEGAGVSLGFGVTVEPHPALKAKARLGTLKEASRDLSGAGLGTLVVPDIFRDPEVSRPLQFTASRGHDPGLNLLELREVENPDAVTQEAPLELTLDLALEDQHLLAYAFDGEFFLPLGYAKPAEGAGGGRTRVVLERLPNPDTLRERSLTGSVRILFQKIVGQRLGKVYEHPLLAVAEVTEDGKVSYEKELEKVKARVGEAERILLFTHGIVSNTVGLAASAQLAKLEGDQKRLKDAYDLILTFDYENLHTPIEENARLLKERLERVGLGPNHGKTLHVVAHSMGGLVSRWFVEREGGKEVVQHLVLVGTPNGGSPWSEVQDWATMALGVALNGLSVAPWAAPVLGGLVSLVEKADVSLDQMKAGSDFLEALKGSDDPGIPYTILVGNTSIRLDIPEPRGKLLQRLLGKLQLKQTFYDALTTHLFRAPNDIAVATQSIKAVPAGRSPEPLIEEVASDHISYFFKDEALQALVRGLEP